MHVVVAPVTDRNSTFCVTHCHALCVPVIVGHVSSSGLGYVPHWCHHPEHCWFIHDLHLIEQIGCQIAVAGGWLLPAVWSNGKRALLNTEPVQAEILAFVGDREGEGKGELQKG